MYFICSKPKMSSFQCSHKGISVPHIWACIGFVSLLCSEMFQTYGIKVPCFHMKTNYGWPIEWERGIQVCGLRKGNNTDSQSCAVANSGQFMAGNWTIKLGILAGHNQSTQSLVFLLTQLHFGQWNSLQFCLPSLIVQWPTRIFHFQLLCMIVKL